MLPKARLPARQMLWVSPGLVSLVQYLLMLLAIAALLYMLFHGATPEIFTLAFILGAIAAALPSIVFSGILPWRAARRLARLRRNGIPGSAEVLALPENPPTGMERRRGSANPVIQIYLQVPVRVYPTGGTPAYEAYMAATSAEIGYLAPGMRIPVLIDSAQTALVLYVPATPP